MVSIFASFDIHASNLAPYGIRTIRENSIKRHMNLQMIMQKPTALLLPQNCTSDNVWL